MPEALPPVAAADRAAAVEHLGPCLSELRGARCFLTGGTGFVGRWLLEVWTAADDAHRLGSSVTVLTRSADAFRRRVPHLAEHPAVRAIEGDVRDLRFAADGCDLVIHAAFDSSRDPSAAETRSTIVEGTARCLEWARLARARRFLLVSSGAVYGRQPSDVERAEEGIQGPAPLRGELTVYGEAKREAESLTLEANGQGPEVTIARCFAFVGAHLPLDAHFAIGNFIRDGLAGGPIRVRGDGSPVRSYLYAADLAVWLLTLAVRGRAGEAYNVGSEREITIAQLAARVAAELDPRIAVEIRANGEASRADRYVPSTRKIREELGVQETVDLGDAIRRTVAWWASAGRMESGADPRAIYRADH